LCTSALAQTQDVLPAVDEAEKKVDRPDLRPILEEKIKYLPVDPEFWAEIEKDQATGNFTAMVVRGGNRLNERGSDTDYGAEGLLAAGRGLLKLGKSFAATQVFLALIQQRMGTEIGIEALRGIDSIMQTFPYDEVELAEELLWETEFGPLDLKLESFVSFHRSMRNFIFGFNDWGFKEQARINKTTYWGHKLEYLSAIGEVARNRSDEALERFEKIINTADEIGNLKEWARLQKARLIFEKKDYEAADALYSTIRTLPQREMARVILERAWTKYYLQDYSKSLGLLSSLEAPFYRVATNHEKFILRMIIYRDLCHYESVADQAKEFSQRYASSFTAIRGRGSLFKDDEIARMTLIKHPLQAMADFVNLLRSEREWLVDFGFDDFEFMQKILDSYDLKEKEMIQRIEARAEPHAREIANRLLDAEEQVAFIDYSAKLDALRVLRSGSGRKYESEKISYLRFDRIFWPQEGEFWFDEADDLKVLISSRCDQNTMPNVVPETNEEEFEEFE